MLDNSQQRPALKEEKEKKNKKDPSSFMEQGQNGFKTKARPFILLVTRSHMNPSVMQMLFKMHKVRPTNERCSEKTRNRNGNKKE